MSAVKARPTLTLTSTLGSLRLGECLYRSRRTEVWEAGLTANASGDHDLVVKRPAGGLEVAAVVAALSHEARLLREVRCDYVVELVGCCGGDDRVDGLVLRRLAGSLDHRALPLPAAELTRYASDIARALRCLHAAGIVHRDLRPANILLRPAADGEQAVVADLDHALELSAAAGRGAQTCVVGAPGYIAPELYRGRVACAASDVYALGVTLFALATGERPFAHPDAAVERRRARCEAALPIASYARHTVLPSSLTAAIEAALTTDPNRRPSVEEILHAAQENP